MPPAEEPFWGYIHALYDRLAAKAPADHVTRVSVHLNGGEEFSPGVVRAVPPWFVFESADEDGGSRVVIVRPEKIEKIEIGYVHQDELDGTIGFQVRETEPA
jgi:hypothetical protein